MVFIATNIISTTGLKDFKTSLSYFSDWKDTGAIITKYKPARPANFRQGVQTISGYTKFQQNYNSDCIVEFTLAFQIKANTEGETQKNIQNYYDFLCRSSEKFVFSSELGRTYVGYIQDKFEQDTPIEGDIYYIATELYCPHNIGGLGSGGIDGL